MTTHLDEDFKLAVSKKSGVEKQEIDELVYLIEWIHSNGFIPDDILLSLNNKIDSFYQRAK